MGIERTDASVLRGAIDQRLVRKICPHCAVKSLRKENSQSIYAAGLTVRKHGSGRMRACGGSGFRGRTVISETFCTDSGLEDLILKGKSASDLAAHLHANGMTPLSEDGIHKAASGITTLGEIEREIMLYGGDD
jgi:type II secretory ATPase GspE/PulE/Tfp pilus assembly ATPase PilB-like protein